MFFYINANIFIIDEGCLAKQNVMTKGKLLMEVSMQHSKFIKKTTTTKLGGGGHNGFHQVQ
jgi:hypothetical protein